MSSILKGNFTPAKNVSIEQEKQPNDLESQFEREALKRLGGSIVFVSKKKVAWDLKD
ncbi:hypothetical protein [Magnetospirillum sp. ME-1]|uniref:hypothetical protein n=1 Tax=Magnetospirillum sp. ME-1 TaxID=1639348 RepID=UPI00143D3CC9|nr:hypothetical protein [Magnetospirillum sp. ME-1]